MKKFIKEEIIKSAFGLVVTTAAIFIALSVDSCVDTQNERGKFVAVLKAINLEAKSNQEVLNQSFQLNVGKKVVYREFDVEIARSFMSDKSFLDYASSKQVKDINTYLLVLRRANSFRAADQNYWERPIRDTTVIHNLRSSFKRLLPSCNNSIQEVVKSTDVED